jgi:hypothetical protein
VGEELGPGADVGPAAEQRTSLPLGHPAPDTELGPVVERVRQALGHDGTALAHDLGLTLGLALDEQGIGVGTGAATQRRPVRDPLALSVRNLGGLTYCVEHHTLFLKR